MSKCAVYAATRELYGDLLPSVKSLLMNSDVEKVYLLIEDDSFPEELPKEVTCINVSKLNLFRSTGPNMVYKHAYMSMMRVALCDLLPDEDKVLSFDVDVIVDGDISGLWNLPLDDYYFAAVPEPAKCRGGNMYFNTGVVMFNLAKLRDGKAQEMIKALNWQRYIFLDQDCLNDKCQGHILALPSTYNATNYTEPVDNPKIVHYAGVRKWANEPLVEKYMEIPLSDIRKPRRGRKPAVERAAWATRERPVDGEEQVGFDTMF